MTEDERYPLSTMEKWFPGIWTILCGGVLTWLFINHRAFVWGIYHQFALAWVVVHFGGQGLLAWRKIRVEKWSFGSWIYRRRWRVVFLWWVVPAILAQMVLVAWGYDAVIHHYAEDPKIKDFRFPFPTVGFTLPLWPLILLLWYIRDVNRASDIRQKEEDLKRKDADISQGKLNQLQQDFHQLQEWACDSSKDFAIRASAIHQLGRYLSGEIIDAAEPQENPFQIPTFELLKALVKDSLLTVGNPKIEGNCLNTINLVELSRELFFDPERLSIIAEIQRIFNRVFSQFAFEGSPLPTRSILKRGFHDAAFPGFDFSNSWFNGAIFTGTDLRGANLRQASLQGARLIGVDLQSAILQSADLSYSTCYFASLQFSILNFAKLHGAALPGADLNEASLRFANLQGASLHEIKNWKTIRSIEGANLFEIKYAPRGFREWAIENGAVELPPEEWEAFVKNGYKHPDPKTPDTPEE